MGYPTAYRTSLARSGSAASFQGRSGRPGGFSGSGGVPEKLPTPANDNELSPANDNSFNMLAIDPLSVVADVVPGPQGVALRNVLKLYHGYVAIEPILFSHWQQVVKGPKWVLTTSLGCLTSTGMFYPGTTLGGGVCGETHGFNATPRGFYATDTRGHYQVTRPGVFSKYEADFYSNWDRVPLGSAKDPQVWVIPSLAPADYSKARPPMIRPTGTPYPDYFPWPQLNPGSRPINTSALPREENTPWSVTPLQRPAPYIPRVVQHEASYYAPNTQPEPSFSPSARNAITGKPIASEHRWEPPPVGTKERKFMVSPAASNRVRAIFDAATEAGDFIDAVYGSLPKHIRPQFYKGSDGKWHHKRLAIQDKAAFILLHATDIDMMKALNNILDNNAKDNAYGQAGKKSGEAARAVHNSGYGSPSRGFQLTRH
jgi:hypothetical protein